MTRPVEPPNPDRPREVSRFEFALLNILRFFLGHSPSDRGLRDLRNQATRPPCISRTAIDLVQDSLAKGCILALVRAGGWRNDRFLRDGQPLTGRIWERSPLEERTLRFSPSVFDFLLWATAERVHESTVPWDATGLTPTDELFFWLAFDACRADPDVANALRGRVAFRENPLCWLTFPGEMTVGPEPTPPSFDTCFTGLGAAILECLQPELARRWIRSERSKGQIGDWGAMRNQGRAEYAALNAFLEAAQRANRLDLARFVLNVNAALFHGELQPIFWTGGLQGSGPSRLADRLDTQRAALAVPRQMDTLSGWEEAARGVGYFDDGYAASQMYKLEWESAGGDRITQRARIAVDAIEPLRSGAE